MRFVSIRSPGRARESRPRPSLGEGILWVSLSLAIHAVALLVLLALPRPSRIAPMVVFVPLEEGSPEPGPIAYRSPPVRPERPVEGRAAPERGLVRPSVAEESPGRRVEGGAAPRDTVSPPRTVAVGTRRRLGPAYGDGRLWVPPVDILELGRTLPAPGGEAAAAQPGVETLERLATERLMAFLDTMPRDSFAPVATPSWTTEIAGKTWGIDSRWIYLGDIKLPAALLALLPLPQGGYNFDQGKVAQELMRMRQDLLNAARRAETAAEFQKYVKELRKRKEEERQQRVRVARDTIIP